ncbi:MAG: menaquinone biosynthesis protein [Candidatus Sericytochromatia bacterium]|nr:menaquinone biosynthesis protein [Candidatus Sericytochromatia bacterium]
MASPFRVGELTYISGWPVQWPLRGLAVEPDAWSVSVGRPGELDAWMEAGDLDAGPVSSLAYMRHRDRWALVPDLSISAWGRLGSATLFSHVPFQGLTGATVAVPHHGGTSTELVRWLLDRVFGVDAALVEHDGTLEALLRTHTAALLIGDPALQAAARDVVPHRLDLGQAWWQLTQTPFVTTVWACRKDLPPAAQAVLTQGFLTSREGARAAMAEVVAAAARKLELPAPSIEAYYALLNFELTPVHHQALNLLAEQLGPAPTA